jgi:hypothetical protein
MAVLIEEALVALDQQRRITGQEEMKGGRIIGH